MTLPQFKTTLEHELGDWRSHTQKEKLKTLKVEQRSLRLGRHSTKRVKVTKNGGASGGGRHGGLPLFYCIFPLSVVRTIHHGSKNHRGPRHVEPTGPAATEAGVALPSLVAAMGAECPPGFGSATLTSLSLKFCKKKSQDTLLMGLLELVVDGELLNSPIPFSEMLDTRAPPCEANAFLFEMCPLVYYLDFTSDDTSVSMSFNRCIFNRFLSAFLE